jgi:hypothetical protein
MSYTREIEAQDMTNNMHKYLSYIAFELEEQTRLIRFFSLIRFIRESKGRRMHLRTTRKRPDRNSTSGTRHVSRGG